MPDAGDHRPPDTEQTEGHADHDADAEAPLIEVPTIPGAHDLSIEVDGQPREFIIYLPASAFDAEPHPLLVVLHGGGGNREQMRNLQFEPRADADGAILVYPQGLNDRWTDGRANTENEQAGIDDVAFLDLLIELIADQFPVDSSRIGVTGASNGGMMSYRMACQSTHRLSIVAAVIASLPTDLVDQCDPEEPPSILGIQGTADEFVTFTGGDVAHDRFPNLGAGGPIESADATREFWLEQLGCDAPDVEELEPIVDDDPTWVERFIANQCEHHRALHYYVVHEMGHAWPPFPPAAPAISGATSRQLRASELIWNFLLDHPIEP